MKFRLPELMVPLSALGETNRTNARQGRVTPQGGNEDTDTSHAICVHGGAVHCHGHGLAATGPAKVSGGFEPRHYHTGPLVRSKKKRFG